MCFVGSAPFILLKLDLVSCFYDNSYYIGFKPKRKGCFSAKFRKVFPFFAENTKVSAFASDRQEPKMKAKHILSV